MWKANPKQCWNFKKQFAVEHRELQILFYYGEQWPSIHHARMRIDCSKLKNELFNNLHVTESPSYTCGGQYESGEHFSLYCTEFYVIRCHLIGDIQVVMLTDIEHILFGNPDYMRLNQTQVSLRLFTVYYGFT